MFVRKIIKFDASVFQYAPDPECAFFAAFTRHYFSTEDDLHFRPCPNSGAGNRLFLLSISLKDRHLVPLKHSYAWICGRMAFVFPKALADRSGGLAARPVFELIRKFRFSSFFSFYQPYRLHEIITGKNVNPRMKVDESLN